MDAASLPVDVANHKDIEEETTEPTCTEGGKVSEVCKDCGAVISETVIPAKGHTEVKEHKDPTETEDGYKSYLYRLYVQYYGKQDEEIYQTIRGLHELGLAIPHDKLRSIVFHLIHNIK